MGAAPSSFRQLGYGVRAGRAECAVILHPLDGGMWGERASVASDAFCQRSFPLPGELLAPKSRGVCGFCHFALLICLVVPLQCELFHFLH